MERDTLDEPAEENEQTRLIGPKEDSVGGDERNPANQTKPIEQLLGYVTVEHCPFE